jgi:hypothetical protein
MDYGSLLLAQAMLEQALEDWRAGLRYPEWSKRGRLSADAADWLFNDERRAILTFADVCDVLGAEPSWMRATIRAGYDGEVKDDDNNWRT